MDHPTGVWMNHQEIWNSPEEVVEVHPRIPVAVAKLARVAPNRAQAVVIWEVKAVEVFPVKARMAHTGQVVVVSEDLEDHQAQKMVHGVASAVELGSLRKQCFGD